MAYNNKSHGLADGVFASLADASLIPGSDDSGKGKAKSGRGNQGFASMSKDKQREIASKGGKAAHAQGTAHEWSSSEAAEAGRRGGKSKTAAK